MTSETTGEINDGGAAKYDGGTDRSNFLAFVIGGLVIGVSAFAFLFYDGMSNGRDVMTTGSTLPRAESPAAPVTTPAPVR